MLQAMTNRLVTPETEVSAGYVSVPTSQKLPVSKQRFSGRLFFSKRDEIERALL